MRSARWPSIRAGILALVVGVHGIAALPLPRVLKAEDAKTELAREEIGRWVRILRSAGWDIDDEQLVAHVNTIGRAAMGTRRFVLAPFQPLLRLTGTGQSWALFAYPDRYPNRLEVDGKTLEGGWELLYRANDPGHTMLAPQLEFRRVRGVYDTASSRDAPGRVYDRFVDMVARQVFARRPDLDTVRVKMVQFRVSLPGESGTYPEKTRLTRLRSRDQVEL